MTTDKVWDLRLNPDVPLRVFIDRSVGRSEIDLSQLQVTDFEMNGGVGEAQIIMPGRGQVEASVDGGIGSILVQLPQEMAARVQVNGGLGDIDVEGDFQQVGDEYRTSDYETADDRVNLVVDGGIGKITVRRR